MVFMDKLDNCVCGAFQGILHPSKGHDEKPALSSPNANKAPMNLPASVQLPVAFAQELQKRSDSGPRWTALAGIAAPVVAAVWGVVDGLAYDEEQRSMLQLALRRELRQLAHSLGAAAAAKLKTKQNGAGRGAVLPTPNEIELVLSWCATPAVPTYSTGVHMVIGFEEEEERQLLTDLAWIFRLLCYRARINPAKEAPMLEAVCEAICRSENKVAKIQQAMERMKLYNRHTSWSSFGAKEEAPFFARCHSEG